MRDLCVIGLLLIASPWVVGIVICILKFLGEKYDKFVRYFELTKLIRKIKRLMKQSDDSKVVRLAFLIEAKHQRSQIFSIDDLKIWRAFI